MFSHRIITRRLNLNLRQHFIKRSTFTDALIKAISPQNLDSITIRRISEGAPINNLINNMKALDSFTVEFFNLDNYSYKNDMYVIKIKFKKDNMDTVKTFKGNNIDEIVEQIKLFMVNEIKI